MPSSSFIHHALHRDNTIELTAQNPIPIQVQFWVLSPGSQSERVTFRGFWLSKDPMKLNMKFRATKMINSSSLGVLYVDIRRANERTVAELKGDCEGVMKMDERDQCWSDVSLIFKLTHGCTEDEEIDIKEEGHEEDHEDRKFGDPPLEVKKHNEMCIEFELKAEKLKRLEMENEIRKHGKNLKELEEKLKAVDRKSKKMRK
ncbi:hypothetical protein M422DRAFT_56610 [Sphaerobolus stellatus SS14]|uniref:Uncharacterized protein n=1 Tax=Sphaerobolus stellatus (strain SS14) TaxID=990650 RepID=A0A0C9TPX5_SPHS4|nr:hypothetical protein M422DRAFT_56610 [Sphaerobolus stellatus SS14]